MTEETQVSEKPSALAQITAEQQSTQQQAEEITIPDKFHVKTDSGELDYQATANKMAQSYTYLEKRMGSGEAPPKTADEYSIALSEDIGLSVDDIKSDALLSGFVGEAHKRGFSNDQLNFVLDAYFRAVPQDMEAMELYTAKETVDQIFTEYGEQKGRALFTNAELAVRTSMGDSADRIIQKYGNDPDIIKMMAHFGEGLNENRIPQNATISQEQFSDELDSLVKKLEEMPLHDPRREEVLRRKNELYERKYPKK